jgi:peptidoglycan/xylan/chitin deacetylase (PgdA/CDA1 family)
MIKNKGMTINSFIIFGVGGVMVLASILVYLFVLKGVMGRFDVTSQLSKPTKVFDIFDPSTTKVAILYSNYTENLLPEGSTWLVDNINTWTNFLKQYKVNYDIIRDVDIEQGRHKKYSLIILPGSKSMSDQEVISLKKFIDAGGSLFATSGTGSFSNDGKWRGWEFFSEVYGLKFVREIDRDETTKIHTLRGNLPITANIPTGFPLKIATWDRPIAVEVLEPRTTQVSFWYNYRLEMGLVREQVKKSAGIAYGNYGKGRFVWMGFEINSVIGVQEDFIYFDKLFGNSINWLVYRPIAFVKDWPGKYESAAIFAVAANEQISNLNNLLPIFKGEGVKATVFFDPTTAESHHELLKNTANVCEIGALIDVGYLSSINDTINKLNDFVTQNETFKSAGFKLKSFSGTSVTGVLPLYGLFDDNSLLALAQNKLKFIITDSLTDRSVPRTIIKGDNSIISITKTARDDYEVIRDYGLTQPDFQLYTYLEDVDRVLFEGGLYIFKMHTEFQGRAEYAGVLRNIIKYMKEQNIWITSATEIYNWWVKKNKIELRIEPRGESRIVATISNPGFEEMSDFFITIDMQMEVKNITITSEMIGTVIPEFKFDHVTKILSLKIEKLRSKQSRIYYIDFDIPNV